MAFMLAVFAPLHAADTPAVAATATAAPKSLAYVLQAEHLASTRAGVVQKLRECGRDVIVLDADFSGGRDGAWSPAEIATIRDGKPNRRVIAYLSIGEAESYRSYWQKSWDPNHTGKPAPGAPAWLDSENPDWKNNYRVRYWQPGWQQIMRPAVEKIVSQGFDGMYLDIVDGFETYEYDPAKKDWIDNRPNPETGNTYRQDMILWVGTLAKWAREKRPDFWVIPQNAQQLLASASYRALISGIGVEDALFSGSKLRGEKQQRATFSALAPLQAEGKPVFLVDYPRKAANANGENKNPRAEAFRIAAAHGVTLLLTDRELTTLGESSGGGQTRNRD